jgi:hypothetical protein
MRCATVCGVVCFCLMAAAGLSGCSQTPSKIDSQADAILRGMCDALSASEGFVFTAEGTVDETLENGQIVQYSSVRKLNLLRPDKIQSEITGDKANRRFWYNGDNVTVLDINDNLYTNIEVPDNIDDMLDYMIETFDITVPLADILYRDPYSVLTENLVSGEYLGKHLVGGRMSHHLVFHQDSIDWQLWVDVGKNPVPLKLVITWTGEPGRPQLSAIFTDWDLKAKLPAKLFVFTPPKDAEYIDPEDLF